MKIKIALDPMQTYVYPIMNWKGIKISAQVTYGGEKSETLPCGFVTNLVYEKKQNRSLEKRLRAVANKLDKPSSTNIPNG